MNTLHTTSDTTRLQAAVTTYRAAYWEIKAAQLFGRKIVAQDGGCAVTMRAWRGKLYMTGFKWGKR